MEQKTINYPYLPEGRTILYVPKDNPYMLEAEHVALTESTDKKSSTGVVVVNTKGEIIISAANQSALKNKFLLDTHIRWCFRKFLGIPSGQKYWLCPGCASSRNHAETGAMKKAKNTGINLEGDDVYLWGHWWCCQDCWNAMIESKIRNVYLMEGTQNADGYNNSNPISKVNH